MIKPINEIPMNEADKRRSYREMIRSDIQEAIDRGIERFEFDGDYNYKFLAQYAREEADMIWRSTWRDIMKKAKEEHGFEGYLYGPNYKLKGNYIKIRSRKMPDRTHVYCEIDLAYPMKECAEEIAKLLKEKQSQEAERQKAKTGDLSAKIADLGFTVRTCNVLLRAGINTMADLKGKSVSDIQRLRNMGKSGTDETVQMMRRFGMEVKGG